MKTITKTKYECDTCGWSSETKEFVEKCEQSHVHEPAPIVKLNSMIQQKLKNCMINGIEFFPDDNTSELSYIRLSFSDAETFEIYPPFNDKLVEIY